MQAMLSKTKLKAYKKVRTKVEGRFEFGWKFSKLISELLISEFIHSNSENDSAIVTIHIYTLTHRHTR